MLLCGQLQQAMADGIILIRWWAPLPGVVAEPVVVPAAVEQQVVVAEPEHRPGSHLPAHPLAEALPLLVEQALVAEVEQAEAAEELLQHQQHRKTSSAPNRICFTSPI